MSGKYHMYYNSRTSHRLRGYDYSQGGTYFITICTKQKKPLFWNNVGATCGRPENEYQLSDCGIIVENEIALLSSVYESVRVDKYIVMPDHIHMLVSIVPDEFGRPQVAPTISRVVQQFKGSITKQVGRPIWQKSFYDHAIRNQQDYDEIWQYIENNPIKYYLKKAP